MIAIVAGLATAVLWSCTTVTAARSSRLIGANSTLAIVMLIGLVIAGPFVLVAPLPAEAFVPRTLVLLGAAGIGNVVGLLLMYRAYRVGLVGVIGSIASTEGAIAALVAVLAGEELPTVVAVMLAVIVGGIVLTASSGAAEEERAEVAVGPAERPVTRGILLAMGAAIAFGLSLYAAGQASVELPIVWAVLPARLVGVAMVSVPMIVAGQLRWTREALPWAIGSGVLEVLGITAFAFGARDGIAITAVLASQFGVVASVLAWLVFHERLTRLQGVGVGTVAVGVAVLTAFRAA